jgi:Na+-driven multidrug efflux pump
MTAVIYLFGDSLVRFFISDADENIETVVATAQQYLRVNAMFYLFLGAIWLYNNTLRGMGDVLIPFISGLCELVMKVGLSLLLSHWFGYLGVWYAMPAGWVLGLAPSAVRFHTGGWKKLADKLSPPPQSHTA